uniref:Uncharacterized protein n=1 Tax=Anopheles farauti TaxID=69004 RepID=A0A182QGT4_9DIPT
MSDSDSSSEDDINARLLSAVDTSFLSDSLYKTTETSKTADGEKRDQDDPVPEPTAEPAPKSNRYLVEDESIFHSDLNVSQAMQKHTAQKISKLIASVIEFDETVGTKKTPRKKQSSTGVRLLAGFDELIDLSSEPLPAAPTKKPKLTHRRKLEDEPEPTAAEKISASVCVPEIFPNEVKHWTGPRKRSKEFKYKQKRDGTIVEKCNPFANEFTKARNANMWHESKIRKFKKTVSKEPEGASKTHSLKRLPAPHSTDLESVS